MSLETEFDEQVRLEREEGRRRNERYADMARRSRETVEVARREEIKRHLRGVVTGLDVRQFTAVVELLCGKSQIESCRIAGYADPESQASRVFGGKKIRAAIAVFYDRRGMKAERWLERMTEQAEAVYSRYFYWNSETNEVDCDVKSLIEDGYGHLIKNIIRKGKDGQYQEIEWQPVFDSQMAIAKHLGLLRDVAVNLDVDLGTMSDEELGNLAERLGIE